MDSLSPHDYTSQELPFDFSVLTFEHVIEGCQCKGKWCNKCEQVRCCKLFARDRRRSEEGLQSACKECNKAYREAHHAEIQEYKSEYRQTHAVELVEKQAAYVQVHAEQIKEYLQGYYQRTIDTQRIQRQRNYLNRREYYAAKIAQYKRDNPDLVRALEARRRTRKTQAGGSYTDTEWQALKAKYDYRCLRCSKQEPEIKLTADHIIPVTKHGSSNIDNIQPLCKSCNSKKHNKIIDYRLLWLLEREAK